MKNKTLVSMLSVLLISLFSPSVFSQDAVVHIEPSSVTPPPVGEIFSVDTVIKNGQNVAGCQVWIEYDPSALLYVDNHFKEGDYFSINAFYGEREIKRLFNTRNRLQFAVTSSPFLNSGDGIIATLTFKVLAAKNSSLTLVRGNLSNETGSLLSDVVGNLVAPSVEGTQVISPRVTPVKSPLGGLPVYTASDLKVDKSVWCVAYSPDGTILAGGSEDSKVHLWNVSTGNRFRVLDDLNDKIYSVAFSPKDTWFAAGGDDGNVWLWKRELAASPWLNTGNDTWQGKTTIAVPRASWKGSHATNDIWSIAFSPDEKKLAVGTGRDVVFVFEYNNGKWTDWEDEKMLEGHTKNVKSVDFHPTDNNILASASDDGTVIIWKQLNGEWMHSGVNYDKHEGNVNSVAFSPNGNYFASGSDDGTAILWELGNPEPIHTFKAHTAAVLSVVFNGDGTQLLTGSEDKRIGVGNVYTGTHQTLQRKHSESISSIAYNLQRDAIATGSHDNTVWQQRATNLGNCIALPLDIISEVAFGPESTYFIFTPQYPRLIGVGVNDADVYYSDCNITLDLSDVRDDLNFWEKYVFIPSVLGTAVNRLALAADALDITSNFLNSFGIDLNIDTSTITLENYLTKIALMMVDGKIARYFMFELKTPEDRLRESITGFQVDLFSIGLGAAIGLIPVKGDAISLGLGLTETVISKIKELHDILKDTVDPKIGLRRAVNDSKFGVPPPQQRLVVIVPKREKQIEIKIELEYDFKHLYTVTYAGPLNLESTFAAPNAQTMSLADYPAFQQLAPEVQDYILRYLGQTANLKTTNIEAWQIPKQTSVLPNYPNPFNPETWIPYQLSEPADVTLFIHSVDGKLVRTLTLGHQAAGRYQSKSRAAYWDGRNAFGEPVASGVYFYTLNAGKFTATRKMLIRK